LLDLSTKPWNSQRWIRHGWHSAGSRENVQIAENSGISGWIAAARQPQQKKKAEKHRS